MKKKDKEVTKAKTVVIPISRVDQAIFDKQIKHWVREEQALGAILHSLYYVIWGQCSPSMQEKLNTRPKLNTTENKEDVPVVSLLKDNL